MKHPRKLSITLTLFVAVGLLLSACNMPAVATISPADATLTEQALQTEVAQTVEAEGATSASGSGGSDTPAPTAAPGEPTGTPSPTIEHQTRPGSPGPVDSFITDRSTAPFASEQRAVADNFNTNFLERPYTSEDMQYQPHLDLTRAEWSASSPWIYVSLHLEGSPPADSEARYGLEVDLDMDGRGDWLIWGLTPTSTDWTVSGVQVFNDANDDVGDARPMRAEEPPQSGDGYEQRVFNAGQGDDPDAAWIRLSPGANDQVQLAFKASLIGNDNELLWNAWTDQGVQEPGQFDYHDHFSVAEAGSPVQNSNYYPVQALALVDNTCRWTYDFEPTQNLPGMCPLPETPTPTVSPTVTPTATRIPKETYTISGFVYHDQNSDGSKSSGEPGWQDGRVELRPRACGASATDSAVTGSDGRYSFSGLSVGTYCVVLTDWPSGFYPTSSTQVEVRLGPDKTVNFGIQVEG